MDFTEFFESLFNRNKQADLPPKAGPYFVFKMLSLGFTFLLLCFISVYRKNIIRTPHLLFTVYCMTLIMCLSVFAYSILMMAFIPAIVMLLFLTSRSNIVGKYFFEGYQASIPNK